MCAMEMSFIELNPWRKAMSFGVEIVKPRFQLDGGPEMVLNGWGPTRIAVPVGRHRVEMWVHWGIYSQMGRNSIDFDVPPGGVRVSWCVPQIAFKQGKMAIEAPSNEPLPVAMPDAMLLGAQMAPVPGAWHPDPTGRHQMRWWDGSTWSPHVSDGGVAAEDPV